MALKIALRVPRVIARYRRKGLKRISGRCLALVSLALLVVLAGLWMAFERWVETAPDPLAAWEYSPVVRDRHGQPLSLFLSADGYWRQQTHLSEVDPTYLAMLLAYEDKRFYSHHGVDWLALVRATGQALWHRDIVSGGSTLTMQVVRLLQRQPTRTMDAKLAQIRAALALERKLDKDAILELYLNLAPMGGNLEGVATASRGYFGKGPGFLSAAEAALLVAIPQSPVARQPHRHPEQARAARERVLERSLSDGLLSAEVVVEANAEPIPEQLVPMPHLSWHLASVAWPGIRSAHWMLDFKGAWSWRCVAGLGNRWRMSVWRWSWSIITPVKYERVSAPPTLSMNSTWALSTWPWPSVLPVRHSSP
ncbi:transglycosylase domain-containing protein [Halomonas binhaiensis]|uniref:transglycosylase domain-containing protein n=1 Tax=Halomonas binhaiensis TaxID=2562282 RepID=UPI001F075F77|nr:transglycosylase domain-containing protein [Halomonas binhaiensis]